MLHFTTHLTVWHALCQEKQTQLNPVVVYRCYPFSYPDGLQDVSRYPYLFAELHRRGWTDDELKNVAGRNLLRVMRETEDVARNLNGVYAQEDWVPKEAVADAPCRTQD